MILEEMLVYYFAKIVISFLAMFIPVKIDGIDWDDIMWWCVLGNFLLIVCVMMFGSIVGVW